MKNRVLFKKKKKAKQEGRLGGSLGEASNS